MTNRTAASRYARALLEVAVKEKVELSTVERDLAEFADLLSSNSALNHALLNPMVPVTRKRDAMAEIATRAGIVGVVAKLLVLLAERDRLALMPDLVVAFRRRRLDHEHIAQAVVTTTSPIPPERERAIEQSLARVTGRTIALATRIDPSIIGGVVAKVGSTVYDGSLARQLEKMRARLENA
jgi:F-type H+-transporting ATPase subunit delta